MVAHLNISGVAGVIFLIEIAKVPEDSDHLLACNRFAQFEVVGNRSSPATCVDYICGLFPVYLSLVFILHSNNSFSCEQRTNHLRMLKDIYSSLFRTLQQNIVEMGTFDLKGIMNILWTLIGEVDAPEIAIPSTKFRSPLGDVTLLLYFLQQAHLLKQPGHIRQQ